MLCRPTKISPEFEFEGSNVKVSRDKKRKSAVFFGSGTCGASRVVRQFYTGGKISACCLVSSVSSLISETRHRRSVKMLSIFAAWVIIYNAGLI